MPNFLDIFTYESFMDNPGSTCTCYMNCVMLRDFGDLKKCQKVHWLGANINLLGGLMKSDDLDIDTVDIYMQDNNCCD